MLVLFTIFTVMIYNGSAYAGEESMKTNMSRMTELMSKFSKQLSSGKVEPKAQEKMGDILSRMAQVMQEMIGAGRSGMHMEHRGKIEVMKKEWDPFDTSGGG
jgi:roadblock/LC7 domain-containing protein